MTTEFLGQISLGAAIPTMVTLNADFVISLNSSLLALNAQLIGAANVAVSLTIAPPQLLATIDAAIAMVASLEAALSIEGPTITLQASAVLALVASLEIQIGLIEVALSLALQLDGLLASTVAAYSYTGPVPAIGSELAAELVSNPPGPANNDALGILLVGTTPGAILALQGIFKTT